MSQRPNVVVLFPDQLRASSLPVYGERHIETPHIDRLASEGVRLTNAISRRRFSVQAPRTSKMRCC